MLSRIFWIGITGIALVIGIALQDGDRLFGWGDDDRRVVVKTGDIETKVDRAVERSFERMSVVDSRGDAIEVPAETKRALAEAVGRLIKAETDFAILRISDATDREIQAARTGRDQARADVERLKAQIKSLEQAARLEQDAVRDQIRQQVRDQVRDTVREAVKS